MLTLTAVASACAFWTKLAAEPATLAALRLACASALPKDCVTTAMFCIMASLTLLDTSWIDLSALRRASSSCLDISPTCWDSEREAC